MQDNTNPTPTEATTPTTPEISPAPGATPVVPSVPAAEPAPAEVSPETSPTSTDSTSSSSPTSVESTPEAATAAAATAPAAAATTERTPGAKNHLVALLLSIFVGTLGIDRFYLGHIGLGVAKLLLSWLTFGIWWLVDVILIATRRVKNVTWES